MSAVRFLDSHGLLDSRLLLGHCVHVDAADIRMIRRGGASISTQPVSNGVLGSGIAPVPAFLQAGINVGIGTDDANCNDACDVLSDLETLGVVQRAVNCDAAAVTAEERLNLPRWVAREPFARTPTSVVLPPATKRTSFWSTRDDPT